MGNLFSSKNSKPKIDPPITSYGNTTHIPKKTEENHSSSINSSPTSAYPYAVNRGNSDLYSYGYSSKSSTSYANVTRPSTPKVSVVIKAKPSVTNILKYDFNRFQNMLYEYIILKSKCLNWHTLTFNTNYYLHNLENESLEYNNIFEKFVNGVLGEIFIEKIERVENLYLLGQYCTKKEEYINKYLPVQEKLMFHGTKRQYVYSICTDNFNWRYHGKTKGNIFGKGVSFTPKSSYANHYCDRKGIKIMIVAKILVCYTCQGNENMIIPDYCDRHRCIRYDTSIKLPKKDVYVKYCDDEFYPAYLIHYTGQMYYPNKGFYR